MSFDNEKSKYSLKFRFYSFLVFFYFLVIHGNAQVGFPYCEDFTGGGTQSATVFGGSARLVDGVLRLTDAQNEQNGYIFIDIPFPSAFGIKASFEFFVYGGNGADGLTVFLFDANVPTFRPGGFGGALGYAQRGQQAGLTGGYLGLGLDTFGNFGNITENKSGGFFGNGADLYPNSVVIRGPGSGLQGYSFVTGRWTNNPGTFSLPASQRFPIDSGGEGTLRVTNRNTVGYRKLFLDLEPNPDGPGYLVNLDLEVTTSPGNPMMVNIFSKEPYLFDAPENLKIGFAASTGGLNNIHEIRNLQVEVSDQEGLENPIASDIRDQASCAGQENTYFITEEEVSLPNEGSVIRCLQFYGSLEEIVAEEEDVCSQGRCRPENRVLELPQGIFRAANIGGDFTFFPNEGFIGDTIRVFYTVTDSFGKTSEGNFIELVINESPEPVRIQAEGLEMDETSARKCEGEGILLEAIGDEEYFSFEWYFNGALLPNAQESEFFAVEPGMYRVVAFNAKSCPTESESFFLINPDFPSLQIENPVVGCTPGMSLDIREFIVGFNEEEFDYRIELPGGGFLVNEEMSEVNQSGIYRLQVKHKDLECWSDPVDFEVIIQTEPVLANFDFEVDGTGIKGDEDGGIFIDDPIRFIDFSTDDVVSWLWDFGDGNTSTDPSPVHVFGRRGIFEVSLTATNSLGCSDTFVLEVPLTLSYRIMIPTGFTPTLEENRFFRPKVKGIVQMEFWVFNLWGNMLFRSSDLNTDGWNGQVNGELMPSGNYAYRVKMVSADGEVVEKSGKFSLIR